ncbi:MAG: hypothetical protein IT438_08260 [Phycisphaerales bacterium]|nr:hypothetical protein [Phycisphaerales bacterium]
MHKTTPSGQLIESSCDFCARVWDPEGQEIMIEGHQGSLLCLKCLSAAFRYIVLEKGGEENRERRCTMCLEDREQPEWQSPVVETARVCLRCVKQAATALEKDPETGWKRPT